MTLICINNVMYLSAHKQEVDFDPAHAGPALPVDSVIYSQAGIVVASSLDTFLWPTITIKQKRVVFSWR